MPETLKDLSTWLAIHHRIDNLQPNVAVDGIDVHNVTEGLLIKSSHHACMQTCCSYTTAEVAQI